MTKPFCTDIIILKGWINMTKNKKIISGIIIAVIIIACVVIISGIYNNIYSGNGVYYSQQGDGKYLQFSKDNTFSYAYNPENDEKNTDGNSSDNIQAYIINSGTWTQNNDKLILTFKDTDSAVTFVEHNNYIYREDTVFKGITSDAKLLKNKYLKEISEDQHTEVWFFDDGTMTYDEYWGDDVTTRTGKYTRVDDILIVRYNDSPDIAHRFLVLENGISEDIYSKKLPEKATY